MYRVERTVCVCPNNRITRSLLATTRDQETAEILAAAVGGRALNELTGEVWTPNLGFWMKPFLEVVA